MRYTLELERESTKELVALFRLIPEDSTELCLRFSNLSFNRGSAFATSFPHIPGYISRLTLDDTSLSKLRDDELQALLARLPPHIITLDLGNNQLSQYSKGKLATALAALPKTILTLYLNNNALGKINTVELIEILNALPPTMTSLDLSRNNLGEKPNDEIIAILQAIPDTVTAVSLAGNRFTKESLKSLKLAFANRPKGSIDIDLTLNDFDPLLFDNPQEAFTPPPPPPVEIKIVDNPQGASTPPPPVKIKTEEESYEDKVEKLRLRIPTNKPISALIKHVELLKKDKKNHPTSMLIDILQRTENIFTDHTTINEYKKFANTMQGKPSSAMKKLGYLMMAIAIIVAAALIPVIGIPIAAGAGCGAVALTGIGVFAASRKTGLCQKMNQVAEAEKASMGR